LRFVDTWLQRLARWFAYIGGFAVIVMAFAGTANIIVSKVFGNSLQNVNDIIDYGLIVVVYCAVADAQFGIGLMRVDIFCRKFPAKVDGAIRLVGYVLGTAMYAFAAYQAISLLRDHMQRGTTAAASVYSFVIWPFTLMYVIGTFFLAAALLWSIVRMVVLRLPTPAPVQPETAEVTRQVTE